MSKASLLYHRGGGGEVNGGGVHFQVNLAVPGLRRELKSQASDSLPPAEA